MADYCFAEITLPARYVELDVQLFHLIENYIKERDDEADLRALLEERDEYYDGGDITLGFIPGDSMYLADYEARWGEFEEIEEYCRKENIPYNRHTRGDMDSDSNYTHWFRPGMKEVQYTVAPSDVAVFEIDEIKKIIDSQPEDMSDTEVIHHLICELSKKDFNSPINNISNWA